MRRCAIGSIANAISQGQLLSQQADAVIIDAMT